MFLTTYLTRDVCVIFLPYCVGVEPLLQVASFVHKSQVVYEHLHRTIFGILFRFCQTLLPIKIDASVVIGCYGVVRKQ